MSLDLTGITLPFTAGDLVTAAMQLLTVVGPIALLAIAFVVAPKFFGLIRSALGRSRASN